VKHKYLTSNIKQTKLKHVVQNTTAVDQYIRSVLKLHATHIQQSALVSSAMGLWGTCHLDDLELAHHVHQSVNFYLCITAVGSGRLLVNTAQFSVPATD